MNTRTAIKAIVAFFILVAIIYRINELQVVNRDLYKENHKRSQEIVELYSEVEKMDQLTTTINDLESVIQSMQKQQTKQENHITELENENIKLKREVENLGKQLKQREASDWMSFNATAYTAKCRGCSGITSTGVDVRDQSKDYKIIAVDPNVIPLGSLVEVQGYGRFRALDTGGDIKGRRVDILHQTNKSAYSFGRRNVKIRIIQKGA